MPILDADLAQIEWRAAAQLSQDPIMIQEIVDGLDMHSFARDEWMKLKPTKEHRTHAKIFNFRAIYRGHPYGFFMDSKMPPFSLKKWERIYAQFYEKYNVLHDTQDQWIQEVYRNGGYMYSETGRILKFDKKNGEYPESSICNYPVSSIAVDVIGLVMILIQNEVVKRGWDDRCKLIMQVHDSIIYDLGSELVKPMSILCKETFLALPQHIKQTYGIDWNVPLDGDVAVGPTWKDVKEIEF
jgi:DNA polymerase I-like protein with 3'-5' exonuclease and polymerase domains